MENFEDIFLAIAKRYVLAYKTLERGKVDVEKEIEKYKKNIETIDELMTNLAISIKMKYEDIEQINKMSDVEFETFLKKIIDQNKMLEQAGCP